MTNLKTEYFDKTTLEFAKNYKAIERVEENLTEYCQYYLQEINKELLKKTKKVFSKHPGFEFQLNNNGIQDLTSSILIKKGQLPIVEFEYGFDSDVKIKNSNLFDYSSDGFNFYALLYLMPDLIGNKTILKKYWNDTLENYFENRGFGIHDHKEDNDIWCYVLTIKIDENFKLPDATKQLIAKFNELFKNINSFKLFTKLIPEQLKP